jgi:hypothetical protein
MMPRRPPALRPAAAIMIAPRMVLSCRGWATPELSYIEGERVLRRLPPSVRRDPGAGLDATGRIRMLLVFRP